MILQSRGFSFNPGTWNNYLRNNRGYTGCCVNLHKDPMYQYTIGQNTTYISKQYTVCYSGSYDDYFAAIMMKYFIDRGAYIMLKVTTIGRYDGTYDTTAGHFILVIGYNTTQPTLKDFIILDPGTSYGDNQNMTLENYDLFISETGYPTIRIYTKVTMSIVPPEMPAYVPSFYKTGDYINLNVSTQKVATIANNFDVSWILKRNGNTINTQNGFNYSYFLSKPGNYAITMVVGGEHGIKESTKYFTVTGEPIIYPEDCLGYLHTIVSELNVDKTNISFKYKTCAEFNEYGQLLYIECNHEPCVWSCGESAIKAIGPNFVNYQHSSKSSYNYSNLIPNSHYKFWASSYGGWKCNLVWFCKYYEDEFFNDCYANIITTPKVLNRNYKIQETGLIEDKAFNKIVLTSGFSYKSTRDGDSYLATISDGQQFWITCNDCDNKKTGIIKVPEKSKFCDCENKRIFTETITDITLQKDFFNIHPNPTNGIINIETNTINSYIVDVYNMQGLLLLTTIDNKINLSNFPSGFYIIKVKSSANVKIIRIFKN